MKKLIFRGPVITASGYGVHARMLLKALIESNKYDITVMSTPWGATPLLYNDDPFLNKVRELSNKFVPGSRGDFDISVQVTIPNEFQRLAPINIGVTAGIEVDKVSPEWLTKCNENVDLVIVPSQHSLDTFVNSVYADSNGNELRLRKPIAIVPEWVDTSVFNTSPYVETDLVKKLGELPDFNFLAVGLGLDKADGEDRKNFAYLIKWFCEQFRNNQNVGLVLKLSMVNFSPPDFYAVQNRIRFIKYQAGCGEFPKISLIHGRLSDAEMANLYKHPNVGALITLTHGEGFGLPIIEAAACGLPVVATNWSGHLDFLKIDGKNKFVPIDYELKDIPESVVWKGVMEKGSKWANPIELDVKMKMAKLLINSAKPREWANELAAHVASNFDSKLGVKFVDHVDTLLGITSNIVKTITPVQTDGARVMAFVDQLRAKFAVDGKKTMLFTMPGSAGDVFISTGVVNSLKKAHPDYHVRFATSTQFFNILSGNKDIDEVIQYEPWMQNVPICEMIFDAVYTPNLDIQMLTSNWIKGGVGRNLGQEIAHRCDVEYGDAFIELQQPLSNVPESYVAFHPGSGVGKHSARNYKHWKDVIDAFPGVTFLQLGAAGEEVIPGAVDFTGKTLSFGENAWVIKNAKAFIGIDSVNMHLAAHLGVPHIALFGSSYACKTGPIQHNGTPHKLIETDNRNGCRRACYKDQCMINCDVPCINNIKSETIIDELKKLL